MTPPKVGFYGQISFFGVKKVFFGPTKTEKIDFLKKPDLCDLTKSGLQLLGGYLTECSIPPKWFNSFFNL